MASLQVVINALERMAPTRHAAKWDNVGLLVDAVAPREATPSRPFTVFFTNDLTPAVLQEAQDRDAALIVTYHPTPFAALKQFQLTSVPAKVVLTCASRNIAVFSPHTAWDVAPGGLNEWLLQSVGEELARGAGASGGGAALGPMRPVRRADDPAAAAAGFGDGRMADIVAAAAAGAGGAPRASVADVVGAVKRAMGLHSVSLALPTSVQAEVAAARRRAAVAAAAAAGAAAGEGAGAGATRGGGIGGGGFSGAGSAESEVMRVASSVPATTLSVCGGSGSGVLGGPSVQRAGGVLITGEMDHHSVLAACHAGASVVLTGHSNCERGYLRVVADRLKAALEGGGGAGAGGGSPGSSGEEDAAAPPAAPGSYLFVVSESDIDPLYAV